MPSLADKVKNPSTKAPLSKSLILSKFSNGILISLTISWLAPIVNLSEFKVFVNNSVGFNRFFLPECASIVTITDGVISLAWLE